ncbi:MAG: polyphosphate:AMP phosphotransferase [Gammaproteobacteria bacterium]|nr:polyphosphate:AMP phosphotransferase [Gammaproteobacteria bacterium]
MFEAAKLQRKVSKEDFKQQETDLRTDLLEMQRALRENGKTKIIILIAGVEGAGKGEVVNRLNEWMDARGIATYAFWEESDEERDHPHFWRFWRKLPPRGQIAIFFGGWYQKPIEERVLGNWDDERMNEEFRRIAGIERMLSEHGALLKFWYHMDAKDQHNRLKELSRDDRSRWKMLPKKKQFSQHYEEFEQIAERLIRHTDYGFAPWYIIEASDRRYRDLTTARTLLNVARKRLAESCEKPVVSSDNPNAEPDAPLSAEAQTTILDRVDLSKSLSRDDYRKQLAALQVEANELVWEAYNRKLATVLVFEGWDAGGKGGAIRRFTSAIDARLYRYISIAAPTDEERAHQYLWRFWRHVPAAGRISIFDRSWYGRVLVERVEGFASEHEWRRAYNEINDFEGQLIDNGTLVLKFWLHIDQDEQLRRFKEREQVPYKAHKITEEDWRNREKWDEYKHAVNEMVVRTSTQLAPWIIIPSNDKSYARVEVLKQICSHLKAHLKRHKEK